MVAFQESAEFPDTGFLVASVQMEPVIGEVSRNLAHSMELITQAAKAGAALMVLPELSNSGYLFEDRPEAFASSEDLPDGKSVRSWIGIAKDLGIHLVAGILERVGTTLYNSAVAIGPSGLLGVYRKLHLWDRENLIFAPGDLGLPVFDSALGKIGVAICYDGWFPEVYRGLASQGADFVCVPTNWVPMRGQDDAVIAMANTLTMANAHSNGLAVICANRIGVERGQRFIGQSLIVGADGWPMAGPASPDTEEILYATIDPARDRRNRQLNGFNHVLNDRREDVYRGANAFPDASGNDVPRRSRRSTDVHSGAIPDIGTDIRSDIRSDIGAHAAQGAAAGPDPHINSAIASPKSSPKGERR